MKTLLTLLTCLFVLSPTVVMSETVKWDDLVERNGIYYKKFTDVPFTGTVTGKSKGKVKKGKRDGPWVSYLDGQLFSKGTYKDGKRHGPWVQYWLNGKLWSKGTYKNGLKEGPFVSFERDGKVRGKDTGTYKNGEKIEPNVVISETVKYGDLVERNGLFYKRSSDVPFSGEVTGRLQVTIKNGKRVGAFVTYWENGQLMTKGNYKDEDRDGAWVNYYDNGQLMSKGTYKDGKRVGSWINYWKNGELSETGTYKDNKMNGKWVFYDISGKKEYGPFKSGMYKNGKKVSD